jgi:hypothetical protein
MISPKNGWRMFFSETCDNNYRTPTLVHICIYEYMYIGIYAYMFICLYVYIYYTCIYVYVYICIYVYMYICLYVYMYVYIYVYIYSCIICPLEFPKLFQSFSSQKFSGFPGHALRMVLQVLDVLCIQGLSVD